MALEVTPGLGFEISNLNFLSCHVTLASKCSYAHIQTRFMQENEAK